MEERQYQARVNEFLGQSKNEEAGKVGGTLICHWLSIVIDSCVVKISVEPM
jgi:hypothetical protein